MSDTPKGHICKCGEHHRWPAYVYAHARDDLTHTCKKCGEKTRIRNFVTIPKREMIY